MEPWSAAESGRKPSEYAQQLAEHVKATTAWVTECRRKYNASMRRLANKRGRKVQEFSVGQLVKLQAVETKGVERKLLRLFDGPYEVVGRDSPTEYTIQKVGEGQRVKVRVHVDRLGVYNDLMEMDTRSKPEPPTGVEDKKEEFEVEEILDDTGSRKEGSKQYLVKWAGYGPEDNSWVSMQDMVHCSDRVQAYELKKVGVYSIADAQSDGMPGLAVFGVDV